MAEIRPQIFPLLLIQHSATDIYILLSKPWSHKTAGNKKYLLH